MQHARSPRAAATLRVATYNIHRCRGMDRAHDASNASRPSCTRRRRRHRAAGGDRGRARAAGPRRGARRGARHGLGDGADVRCAAIFRQRRAQPPSDRAPRRADLSWKTCEPRGCSARTSTCHGHRCTSTTCISARPCSSGAIRPSGSRRSSPTGTSGAEARARRLQRVDARPDDRAPDAASCKSVDLHPVSEAAPHLSRPLPGPAPGSHLLAGRLEIIGIELPRTRLSLVASDHLPLVADIHVWY